MELGQQEAMAQPVELIDERFLDGADGRARITGAPERSVGLADLAGYVAGNPSLRESMASGLVEHTPRVAE